MKQYKLVNNLVGWLAFVIAAYTYCMTIEPTASFWDCPEFITTGYKLEVGHPPGAPFFMLTANLFSQFTSDPSQVARMVNTMSALMSAACILFLFWSITHLVKKLICPDDKEMTLGKLITIMGSGLVGALAYTWSDTFWFSAVEGEVYAYSSLFTAVVFWLILKWESVANEPHSDRWLVLIAYLTGLSIGVHLLNLLCIPAIVLVYYYKKNPDANLKGSLLALTGSMVLVAAVLYGIVPGVVKVGGWFELLFVNSFGMPFNSGLIVYIILLAASIIWGVYESYTEKSRKRMFLDFDFKDVVVCIGGFTFGPFAAAIISILGAFIEMLTISHTGPIGFIMNVLATCAFSCTACFIYKKVHSKKGAVLGLACGVACLVAVMLLWNYLITPLYMTGYSRADVAGLLPTLFLPFNLAKGGMNMAATLLLYPPVVSAMRRAGVVPSSQSTQEKRINAGFI